MKDGILYFNHGQGCLARLCVSILSLRKYWQGEVAVANEGALPAWMMTFLAFYNVKVVSAPVSKEYGLIKKSRIWRVSPFENTMYLDSDTLIRGPIDEFFLWIREHGLVVTHFNGWHTNRGRMKQRVLQWKEAFPEDTEKALNYGSAINTGVMGWSKMNPIMAIYQNLTEKGMTIPRMQRKTLDELAMQLTVPERLHYLAPPIWNAGCVHSDGSKAIIVHYHGHKHCRSGDNGDMWKAAWRAFEDRHPEWAKEAAKHDQSIKTWLSADDITIVTAVNPEYAHHAKKNLPLWEANAGLKGKKIIVFVNGFKSPKDRDFLKSIPNVKVIRWDYPHEASKRETMLAAFILGVAQHVKTRYWFKLDINCAPTAPFVWPDFSESAITSHRWGYTKMKGSPKGTAEHWLTTMDKLFSPAKPLCPKLDPKEDYKVVHGKNGKYKLAPRFRSLAHIERTDFTKRMAKEIISKCGGKLPIPSQDTIAWYFATLWKQPVKLTNMVQYFTK